MRIPNFFIHKFGRWYIKEINKRDYRSQQFRYINERPIEYNFVFKSVSRFFPRKVLDVGTGTTALPSLLMDCGCLVASIDNIDDYWDKGMYNQHFYIINDNIVETKITEKFDFVTCVSVLEHIKDHKTAIQNMFKLLKKSGHLILTFPYNENRYIENVYKHPEAGYGKNVPYICQVFSRDNIGMWLKDNECEVVDQEYWQVFNGDLWTFGERINPPLQVTKNEKHQLSCILIKKLQGK